MHSWTNVLVVTTRGWQNVKFYMKMIVKTVTKIKSMNKNVVILQHFYFVLFETVCVFSLK